MPVLPTGTVTFLFTDIAGSTQNWQDHPEAMKIALRRHDTILRQAILDNNGYVVKTMGDSFHAAFSSPLEALATTLTAQRALLAERWPAQTPVRVRMGLHIGILDEERESDYFGHEVNRAARIQGVVHPEQIVLSHSVYELIRSRLPEGVTLLDLGFHQLKDLREPERLWQVCHPDLPSTFPPLNSLSYGPNNLPRQLSSFIGREQQIEEVKSLLTRCACLSLVGSGGCGKTRLALQVAGELLSTTSDGVWMVELASLTDASLVMQTVAKAMGLREDTGQAQTLVEYAKPRALLLLLDNCEHLIAACAPLADTLLRACPRIKILVTSRQALNIEGEHIYRVPSLSLPDAGKPQTPESLLEYEASRLFIERAASMKEDFAVTDQNAAALASICQRLEGIPLAIELAAARTRSLTVEDIHSRLDRKFRILAGGSRMALPRQQTLQALIDWSYDLLTEQEKTLFARLSVFAGGWTLEAAEKVCAGEGVEEWEVLDLLASLVDKSLVKQDDKDGQSRFGMLETLREYGMERLEEASETETTRQAHAKVYFALAREFGDKAYGSQMDVWLERLETEHDNLRAALAWYKAAPDRVEVGLRIASSIRMFWDIRGYWSEGRAQFAELLALEDSSDPTVAQAEALGDAGWLAGQQGDAASQRLLYEQSLLMARQVGDKRLMARTLQKLSWAVQDNAKRRSFIEQSLEIVRELDDQGLMADTLLELGRVHLNEGDYVSAQSCYEQGLKTYQELGKKLQISHTFKLLGWLAQVQRDLIQARSYYEQCLVIARECGEKENIAFTLHLLANTNQEMGDNATARLLYEESLAPLQELRHQRSIADTLAELGRLDWLEGDYAQARLRFEASLMIAQELGHQERILDALYGLGRAARSEGDYRLAQSHFEQSLMLRREAGHKLASAHLLYDLGTVALHEGELEAARHFFEESLLLKRELDSKRGIAYSLEGFAALAARQGETDRAAHLFGAAEALREAIASPLPRPDRILYEEHLSAARDGADENAFTQAWAEGRALLLEQAIEYCLKAPGN